jgi:hypothetical protein
MRRSVSLRLGQFPQLFRHFAATDGNMNFIIWIDLTEKLKKQRALKPFCKCRKASNFLRKHSATAERLKILCGGILQVQKPLKFFAKLFCKCRKP